MVNPTNFCNVPWFEIHINHDGSYDLCGCMTSLITQTDAGQYWNVKNFTIEEYWQSQRLREARLQKVNGVDVPACSYCQHQDRLGNHSKRIKENLKSVIFYDHNFSKSFEQSPHKQLFDYSAANNGATLTRPLSYHLSLGNECNLACMMCSSSSSFKLGQMQEKLGWIPIAQHLNWTQDPVVWQSVCNTLKQSSDLISFHLIGGETLINPKFYELVDLFVDNNNTNFSFSFTTNATLKIKPELWNKLSKFKRVEIGISIETISKSNDYIRYGSQINQVLENIQEYKNSATENVDFVMRTVPSMLSIFEYSDLINWCYKEQMLLNSYFLVNPTWQQIKLLPSELKEPLIRTFESQRVAFQSQIATQPKAMTNFKNKTHIVKNLVSETNACINALKQENTDLTLPSIAAQKLKQLDQFRKTNVFDYFPQLESFLGQHGYQR